MAGVAEIAKIQNSGFRIQDSGVREENRLNQERQKSARVKSPSETN
jgi:hypothetical protein